MADGRYKEGYKKYLEAIEKAGNDGTDFPIGRRLEQETRRLQKIFSPVLLVAGVRLIIDTFVDQVVYSQESGWISLGLTLLMGLIILIYIVMAVSTKNKISIDKPIGVAYWAMYLRQRIAAFWMLYLAVILGAFALIIITYAQAGSIPLKILMGLMVSFAGIFLIRSYVLLDYKYYLREAENHMNSN
jgi:hypothetical protein